MWEAMKCHVWAYPTSWNASLTLLAIMLNVLGVTNRWATNPWTGLDWNGILKFVFTLRGMQLEGNHFRVWLTSTALNACGRRRACDATYIATGLLGLDQQLTQTVAKRASTAASQVWDLISWARLVRVFQEVANSMLDPRMFMPSSKLRSWSPAHNYCATIGMHSWNTEVWGSQGDRIPQCIKTNFRIQVQSSD